MTTTLYCYNPDNDWFTVTVDTPEEADQNIRCCKICGEPAAIKTRRLFCAIHLSEEKKKEYQRKKQLREENEKKIKNWKQKKISKPLKS